MQDHQDLDESEIFSDFFEGLHFTPNGRRQNKKDQRTFLGASGLTDQANTKKNVKVYTKQKNEIIKQNVKTEYGKNRVYDFTAHLTFKVKLPHTSFSLL